MLRKASNAVLLPVSTKLTPEGSCNTPIVAPASLLMSTFPRSYPRFGKWLCCLFPSYPKSGFDLCCIYFPNLSQIYPGFFGKQAILSVCLSVLQHGPELVTLAASPNNESATHTLRMHTYHQSQRTPSGCARFNQSLFIAILLSRVQIVQRSTMKSSRQDP